MHLAFLGMLGEGKRRVEKGYWARWSHQLASDDTMELNFLMVEGRVHVGLCKTVSL